MACRERRPLKIGYGLLWKLLRRIKTSIKDEVRFWPSLNFCGLNDEVFSSSAEDTHQRSDRSTGRGWRSYHWCCSFVGTRTPSLFSPLHEVSNSSCL